MRYVRLDTLEPVSPEIVFWGPATREITVKRFHLQRLASPGQVPYLPISALWAVRLVRAVALEARAARIAYLLARDGDGCLYCGHQIDPRTCTIEHIVAQGNGGPDHAANLALACPECNAAAGHLPAAAKLRLALKMRGAA